MEEQIERERERVKARERDGLRGHTGFPRLKHTMFDTNGHIHVMIITTL